MAQQVVFIEGRREGYSPDQIDRTMTVQELMDWLEGFYPDAKVMLKNDNGYTYGSITRGSFEEDVLEDDDDEEEEW